MKNLALGVIFSLFITIGSIASVSANVPGGKKKKKCKTEMKDCKSDKKEKKSCCPSKSESKDCEKKTETAE